jgi:hypothetical protein
VKQVIIGGLQMRVHLRAEPVAAPGPGGRAGGERARLLGRCRAAAPGGLLTECALARGAPGAHFAASLSVICPAGVSVRPCEAALCGSPSLSCVRLGLGNAPAALLRVRKISTARAQSRAAPLSRAARWSREIEREREREREEKRQHPLYQPPISVANFKPERNYSHLTLAVGDRLCCRYLSKLSYPNCGRSLGAALCTS